MEMRNMFLETGGKVIFSDRTWLNYILLFLWEVEFTSDELEYLAEEMFKQSVEGTSSSLCCF